ncbi:Pentatricopeptide repeat-containing protein [Hibiscus syriacus]|uniref:Pentatricopeptide repeat-containing protein n=1 Tax=Hibiscus syriacus TaxID=106335 RepID=A0A6A3B4W7_HIBSY|nr:pentatricopeptide repeat-containing protein At3g62470, mitochondrial-like [Hibiscus syriacus]KAE8710365.1 Pentatricopeptide repeat-containing protein [Hibiscus syriacus]
MYISPRTSATATATATATTSFVRQHYNSGFCHRFIHGGSNADLFILSQRPRSRETRRRGGEQVCFPCGSSLPLFSLLYTSPYYSLRRFSSQIPSILPHSPSFRNLQEQMLVLDLNRRCFSGITEGDTESETEIESDSFESRSDPKEVERVCKVIDELFGLDRNMEAVLDECGINLTHDLIIDVLERFRHARKPAFRFFCWAGQKPGFAHDSRTYNKMMDVLAKNRQFETMLAMLEEMGARGVLTMGTFIIAIKAFAAAKERKKAVGIFDLMKKYKYEAGVDTVNCLLESLGRAKLAKEAQTLFGKLRDRFTPNLSSYTILLNGWCRVRNLMEAGRVWNEMIDKGFEPDIVAHNVMIEGLLRSRKTSHAVKLFEVMKTKGPLPNVRSYTIMIREFCKQARMGEAVRYFEEMHDSGCPPDAPVYTCLITGFGNQRRMDTVYRLLLEMQDKGCPPDGHTYNALIKLLTTQRMPDDAMRVYKKMIQTGIQPTIHTFNMMMKSFFQSRNYDMSCAIWDEMTKKGFCPDDISYTVFIGGLIRLGRSGEACRLLVEMIGKGMKAPQLDYGKFVADFSRAGKPAILEELAQKMKFCGKIEASDIFTRCAEAMKKRVKRNGPFKTDGRCV